MSLAVTLSFCGVDFCLAPGDELRRRGAPSKSGGALLAPVQQSAPPQIVSVRRIEGEEEEGHIIAELKGFSGTLRIYPSRGYCDSGDAQLDPSQAGHDNKGCATSAGDRVAGAAQARLFSSSASATDSGIKGGSKCGAVEPFPRNDITDERQSEGVAVADDADDISAADSIDSSPAEPEVFQDEDEELLHLPAGATFEPSWRSGGGQSVPTPRRANTYRWAEDDTRHGQEDIVSGSIAPSLFGRPSGSVSTDETGESSSGMGSLEAGGTADHIVGTKQDRTIDATGRAPNTDLRRNVPSLDLARTDDACSTRRSSGSDVDDRNSFRPADVFFGTDQTPSLEETLSDELSLGHHINQAKDAVVAAMSPVTRPFRGLLEAMDGQESLSPIKTPFSTVDRPFRNAAALVVAHIPKVRKLTADGRDAPSPAGSPVNTTRHFVFGKSNEATARGCSFSPMSMNPRRCTTKLHLVCADSGATLSQLRTVLTENPDAAAILDSMGRLPIHVIARNEALLRYRRRRDDVGTFMRDLTDVHPAGMATLDSNGDVPLTPIIRHWTQSILLAQSSGSMAGFSSNRSGGLTARLGFGRISKSSDERPNGEHSPVNRNASAHEGSDRLDEEKEKTDSGHFEKSFPDVYVPSVVEWALVMLSLALDNFGGPLSRDKGTRLQQLSARRVLAENVAQIPWFLKILLLIDDDDTRSRILELSLVRRSMLCNSTIGRWLIRMLQKSGTPSQRIADYFMLVSQLNISDFIGQGRSPRSADYTAFNNEKMAVFKSIHGYDDIVSSLMVLPLKDIERVSTTKLVWEILNATISTPFVIGIVLVDFVLHLTLMISLRIATADAGTSSRVDSLSISEEFNRALVIAIAVHQGLRKFVTLVHLMSSSFSLARSYLLEFWSIVDMLAVTFAVLAATLLKATESTEHPIFMALTMCLLWFRLLGLLKAVNRHLATFILSLAQIIKDIRWYLVMAVFVVFMFADMIHIVTTQTDNGVHCGEDALDDQESGVLEDFCSRDLMKSYLRLYAVFVGDFELDDYKTTPFITFLFSMFLLLGAIILLNVLIAIVSESYEKSRIRAAYLFGRARVSFAAEQSALEAFLVHRVPPPSDRFSIRRYEDIKWLCGRIARWVVLASLVGTAGIVDFFLGNAFVDQIRGEGRSYNTLVVVSLVLLIILNVALAAVCLFVFNMCSISGNKEGFLSTAPKNHALDRQCTSECSCGTTGPALIRFMNQAVEWLVRIIFGIQSHLDPSAEILDSDKEWGGRLDYMKQQTSLIVAESEHRMSSTIKESARHLKEHESSVQAELKRDIGRILKSIEQKLS